MRQISFSLTTEQVRNHTKTETRRTGWLWLVEACARGEHPLLQPIVKGQGLKLGQHVEKIGGPIRVVSATREPLNSITQASCIAEGFPHFTPQKFIEFYIVANGGDRNQEVTRIQFSYV